MSQRSRLWLIGMLGALLVSVAACGSPDTTAEADHDHSDHEHTEEPASQLREWAGPPAPEVELTLDGDDKGGTLLTIEAEGFTFTSADVLEPVQGEGHAHLYVDGDLLTMIYDSTFVLPRLPVGDHELTVTLSTNDHLEYTVDGEPIGASIRFQSSDPDSSADNDG